ncbi:MAG: hypothetical protein NW207_07330 [Cytophagales bacterium]|nr:hypothetical protein [Cytophagales bacterium]
MKNLTSILFITILYICTVNAQLLVKDSFDNLSSGTGFQMPWQDSAPIYNHYYTDSGFPFEYALLNGSGSYLNTRHWSGSANAYPTLYRDFDVSSNSQVFTSGYVENNAVTVNYGKDIYISLFFRFETINGEIILENTAGDASIKFVLESASQDNILTVYIKEPATNGKGVNYIKLGSTPPLNRFYTHYYV